MKNNSALEDLLKVLSILRLPTDKLVVICADDHHSTTLKNKLQTNKINKRCWHDEQHSKPAQE